MSQINPFQAFLSHFLKIHFYIFLPSKSRSSKWSLPLRFLYQNPVFTSADSHTCSGLKDLNKSIVLSTPIYVKANNSQVRDDTGIGDTEKNRRLGSIYTIISRTVNLILPQLSCASLHLKYVPDIGTELLHFFRHKDQVLTALTIFEFDVNCTSKVLFVQLSKYTSSTLLKPMGH